MGRMMELVRGIRNVRAEMKVPANKKAALRILASADTRSGYEMCDTYIVASRLRIRSFFHHRQN